MVHPFTSDEEWGDLCSHIDFMEPRDGAFYASLLRKTTLDDDVHGSNTYDYCGGCRTKDGLVEYTTDFHDLPTCLGNQINKEALLQPHETTHRLVKLRKQVPLRKLGLVYSAAEACLDEVNSAGLRLIAEDADVEGKPTCKQYHKPLGFPFWYCTECNANIEPAWMTYVPLDRTFTCDDCENKRTREVNDCEFERVRMRCMLSPGRNKEDMSMNEKLGELETRISSLDEHLSVVDKRLAKILNLLDKTNGRRQYACPSSAAHKVEGSGNDRTAGLKTEDGSVCGEGATSNGKANGSAHTGRTDDVVRLGPRDSEDSRANKEVAGKGDTETGKPLFHVPVVTLQWKRHAG
ncbi:hypothetical protein K488DRAFT_73094 [Vararia minispora EC-137]|uniref:Uncharacterized protein n=1 Tax=Vararia minispora EC-137 TaxID=1314806 RepID=A0ACB8QBQ6_9AGAM|nr:hypothetical protein K488DRAFT_73094 [Vararia minispora EC-137]